MVRNWLMQLQGLVSSKSVGQTSRLEIQVRVDVVVLSPKSAGRGTRQETQAGCCGLEDNWFFFGKLQCLLRKPSNGWMRPTCIIPVLFKIYRLNLKIDLHSNI